MKSYIIHVSADCDRDDFTERIYRGSVAHFEGRFPGGRGLPSEYVETRDTVDNPKSHGISGIVMVNIYVRANEIEKELS